MRSIDIAVIGIGRVGLPLALSLSKEGFKTVGIDLNKELVELVNKKVMPFKENGYNELIKKTNLFASTDISIIKNVKNIIITVGTPLLANIETDLAQLNKVLDNIVEFIKPNHNIILRSTVAPKTTKYVHRFLERNTKFLIGKNLFLSFCPERIAEGKALDELYSLPQIIGSSDKESSKKAEFIFSKLSPKTFHTDYTSAELVKLFNNTYRYINFAIGNQFSMIAESFNVNIHEVVKMCNTDYPRSNISLPGLTAGTCLRKDFGMINETSSHSDLLLNSWKINEFMPKFLIEKLLENNEIFGKKIGILGYTFKKDADDTRDSLVPKLIRYIQREVPEEIIIHEPNISGKIDNNFKNNSLDILIKKSEIIFIAVNHSTFIENIDSIILNSKVNCTFVDIWNVSGKKQIIFSR